MHSITLNVNNDAYEHLIYFLSNLKDDVEVLKDEIYSDKFEIDKTHCIKTVSKIQKGELEDFQLIDDVDRHIEALLNDIS